MYLYIVTFLITLIFICYIWMKKTYNYWNDRGVLGPKPLPIVGNCGKIMLGKEHFEDFLTRIYNAYPNENYVGIYQAWRPALIIKDIDMIKQVLIKDFSFFQGRGFDSSGLYPFNNNPLLNDDSSWVVLRGFWTSLVTLGTLKNYIPLLEESAEKHTKYISGLLKSESIHDLESLFDAFMAHSTMLCLFGIDVDPNFGKEPLTEIVDEFIYPGTISRTMFYGDIIFKGFQRIGSFLNLDPRVNNIKKKFTPFLNKVLLDKDRRQTTLMDAIVKMQSQKFTQKRYDTKINQIENTDTFILTQALFIYIGHTTLPGKVSATIMYNIALQQGLQDRLYKEINQVYRKHNNKLTYESLNEMTYLDMVARETYRKHFGSVVQRVATFDYEFPGDGPKIKKGTLLLIPMPGIHMSPNYYRDPEVFDPERFTPENMNNMQDGTYIPFSIGPRNCLGSRVAATLIKFTVASFLLRFKVAACEKTSKNLQYIPGIMKAKTDGGIWLNISARSDSM